MSTEPRKDNFAKWYFIFATTAFGAMFLGMGYSSAKEVAALRDVLVACYKSGTKDCDKKWEQGLK